jgi:hypothetical protein
MNTDEANATKELEKDTMMQGYPSKVKNAVNHIF